MDHDFLRRQAERARSLAAVADPFIKQRLLDLASRYDERLRDPARASRRQTMLANLSQPLLQEASDTKRPKR
jgi:hypothetical protein